MGKGARKASRRDDVVPRGIPEEGPGTTGGQSARRPLRLVRTGGYWVGVVVLATVLITLFVFVAQHA